MRQFTDKIVEAPRGRDQFAERQQGKCRRHARPQKQREMRQVAALTEDVDQVFHGIHSLNSRSDADGPP